MSGSNAFNEIVQVHMEAYWSTMEHLRTAFTSIVWFYLHERHIQVFQSALLFGPFHKRDPFPPICMEPFQSQQ